MYSEKFPAAGIRFRYEVGGKPAKKASRLSNRLSSFCKREQVERGIIY